MYKSQTKEYRIQYRKVRRSKLKQQCLDYLGSKCAKCGSIDGLEFDHIDPQNKQYKISEMYGLSFGRIKLELDKCQLLCFRHHLEKTNTEKLKSRNPIVHGKNYMYVRYNCRCRPCTRASYDTKKRWKTNKQTLANYTNLV